MGKYEEPDDEESLQRRDWLARARRGDREAAARLLAEYHVVVPPGEDLPIMPEDR